MVRFFAAPLFLILLLSPQTALADLFQYTDQSGTVVIVDDESKIPRKYRKQIKTTKAETGSISRTTSVKIRNNQVLVPVRFSYRDRTVDAWLLLDTGATGTVISTKVANSLGIKPASTESRLSQVADGRVVQAFRTRVDYINVGPKTKYNAEIAIIPSSGPDMGFDGLLGMNFLSDYPYHLDMNTEVIQWQ
jgi:predicted aspartyl protease